MVLSMTTTNSARLIVIAAIAFVVAAAQDCSSASTCDDCTELPSCGWCTYSGTCESGNATESFTGCSAPYWSWTSSQCGTPAPSSGGRCDIGNCDTCTAQAGCGYCLSTSMCESGNANGSSSSDCSSADWAWSTSQCAVSSSSFPNACGDASNDCVSCTTMGGCGYCVSSTYCEGITASGSTSGECSQWVWNSTQC
jgi:hypothetical protein